jgi:ATP-dependent Clp protease ATP-binding subunit ClpC
MAKKRFKPEFVNRVDDVIVFRRLERDDLKRIVDIEVDKVRERLSFKDLGLVLDDKVLDFLIDRGYEPEYGARPLRRAIERYLEDPLAEDLLKGHFKNSEKIRVEIDNQKLLFFPDSPDGENPLEDLKKPVGKPTRRKRSSRKKTSSKDT